MSDTFMFIFGLFVYSLAVAPLVYVLYTDARSDE